MRGYRKFTPTVEKCMLVTSAVIAERFPAPVIPQEKVELTSKDNKNDALQLQLTAGQACSSRLQGKWGASVCQWGKSSKME